MENKSRLSIGEASDYLGVSIDTLRRWEKKGKVESLRSPGNHRYFLKDDLDKLFGKKYEHDSVRTEPKEKPTKPKVPDETPKNIPDNDFSYASIIYPTANLPVDERILDRPAREIKIPDVKIIRIIRTQEEIKVVNNQVKEIESEKKESSILTPVNLERQPDKGTGETGNTALKNSAKPQGSDSNKKNLTIYISLIVLLLITIALVFFLIGASSQDMLSPVPR